MIGSGFTEVLVRSDNEPAILALKESAATALKLAGVNVKISSARAWGFNKMGLKIRVEIAFIVVHRCASHIEFFFLQFIVL